MSNNESSNSSGIGLSGILAIVFIVLKLTNVIDWSWWWVLVPILWPVYVIGITFIAGVALALFAAAIEAVSK